MSNYDRGLESVIQMLAIVGIIKTIEVGIQTYKEYQAAIEKKLIARSIEHDEFYEGFYYALTTLQELQIKGLTIQTDYDIINYKVT